MANVLHISKDHGRTAICLVIHEFEILQAKEWHPTSPELTVLQSFRDDVILLPWHQFLKDYTPLIESFDVLCTAWTKGFRIFLFYSVSRGEASLFLGKALRNKTSIILLLCPWCNWAPIYV